MYLGAPKNIKRIINNNGLNSDIISAIHSQLAPARKEVKIFAKQFKADSNLATAQNIWNYLRTLRYIKDPSGYQFIKLPKKLASSYGDCKSYSLMTAAILQELNMPVSFRYTSYDVNDSTPSHVYIVTKDEQGKDIIIDGVYNKFNQEVPYKHKKDYKMQIAVINGVPAAELPVNARYKKRFNPEQLKNKFLENQLTKVKPSGFLFNVIQNELRRINNKPSNIIYSPEQLQKYLKRLKNRKSLVAANNWVSKLLQNEINAIELNRFTGVIKFVHSDKELSGIEEEIGKLSLKKIKKSLKKVSLKNILKGVKKVGLAVPRKAFLSLVFLNVRGLAKRLSKFNRAELINLWENNFGGKISHLDKAIKRGAKKRALFGASKRVKQLRGIGYAVYSSDDTTIHGIGVQPTEEGTSSGAAAAAAAAAASAGAAAAAANPAGAATTASIIAAAAPILVVIVKALNKAGVPEEVGADVAAAAAAGENQNFSEVEQEGNDKKKKFGDYLNMAVDIATKTGVIPSPALDNTEATVNDALSAKGTDEDKNEAFAAGADYPPDETGTTEETTTTEGGGIKKMLPLLIGGAALVYFITKKKK